MELGIVGLPNVGKSTLFNALTRCGVEAANYPFCTIEPNVGVVEVPDERLDLLVKMVHPRRRVPAAIRFVDIAGLVRGASKGEGLGNQFLSHIREVDAVVHVVRCFGGSEVAHVEGTVDALRDVETIETELALADLEAVERRLNKASRMLKSGEQKRQAEVGLLERLQTALNDGRSTRSPFFTAEERTILKDLPLLTAKPILYAANVGEEDLPEGAHNPQVEALRRRAAQEGALVAVFSARVEAELAELGEEEREEFLSEYGLKEPGLYRLVREGYRLLDLITFFTAGEPEARAWTIQAGTKAPAAAGKIHSDLERGFIRAEVVSFPDLVAAGGMAAAREKGWLRLEGKDYVMQDGDVVYFRFNV